MYNGFDFGGLVQAELVEPAALPLLPDAVAVPGRPGGLLLGCELPPRELALRLFLDAGSKLNVDELAAVRRELRAALVAVEGAPLSVPGEPGLTWRDAVLTGVSGWDSLFEGGSCELAFTCYDPVAYGDGASSDAAAFTVGGTWRTWPVFELTARAGSAVRVSDGAGSYVSMERAFRAGDAVRIDCWCEAVTVNGADAAADVALGSAFFALEPGACSLSFSGCSAHETTWTERWL